MLDNQTMSRRLAEAYKLAELSPDDSNQNGAVVYSGDVLLSTGYNHFYEGVPPTQERPAKYERIVHAEADACLSLASSVHPVDVRTVMYCPWAACKACVLSILGSGIKSLVLHADRGAIYDATRNGVVDMAKVNENNWKPEIDEAFQWLDGGGVDIHVFRGHVHHYRGPGIKVNSRLWNPSSGLIN